MIPVTQILLVATATFAFIVNCHVRLLEPSSRSSLWRNPKFQEFHPPVNTKDDGVYCDQILQPPVPVNCGVCGDPFTDATPRPNEHGGLYGQGIISGQYKAGQEIEFSAEITVPHNGSFWLQLCDELPETNECFVDKQHLEITTIEGLTLTKVPITGTTPLWVNGTMKLPTGVSCQNCVLRLNYRSGNIGDCDDGTKDYGCGLQQTFRACSDISIALQEN